MDWMQTEETLFGLHVHGLGGALALSAVLLQHRDHLLQFAVDLADVLWAHTTKREHK